MKISPRKKEQKTANNKSARGSRYLACLTNREREKEKIWEFNVIVGKTTNQHKSKRAVRKPSISHFLFQQEEKLTLSFSLGNSAKGKAKGRAGRGDEVRLHFLRDRCVEEGSREKKARKP